MFHYKKMNRLKLQKFYLIGPMDRDREGGKVWREDLSLWLSECNAIFLDPYHKPILFDNEALEDERRHELILGARTLGDYDTVSTYVKKLRVVDLRMVAMADALICYLDLDKHPCGAYEEMFTANQSEKPIIVMCPQGYTEIPLWLFGVLPHEMFFDDWNKVKEYLRHIDEDAEINTLDRWRFFDLEPQIRKIIDAKDKKE